ncbi:MAG: carboxymuconolactone decarboxylase family protein [Pseudomonadota bacterium]
MDPTPRIAPLDPPFAPPLQQALERITPPGAPNILALFRVLARHPELMDRMRSVGGFLLGPKASLALREREVVIDRVSARCGAEYEWGVHVAAFGEAAGFTEAENAAIADPNNDGAALAERDRLLVRMVDQLHDTGTVDDALWAELAAHWSEMQLIELLVLAGWYHAIAYVCTAARVPPETWAARWSESRC